MLLCINFEVPTPAPAATRPTGAKSVKNPVSKRVSHGTYIFSPKNFRKICSGLISIFLLIHLQKFSPVSLNLSVLRGFKYGRVGKKSDIPYVFTCVYMGFQTYRAQIQHLAGCYSLMGGARSMKFGLNIKY